ncbi:MAG: efflux RND transporter periplasmic adaptor subunit [Candidatus Lambdaproteobacteria bacterium]|nr:efflux RND transporter periplasmic adaptor subunit [Candidatus Lambdaproteobacteria bacterium]
MHKGMTRLVLGALILALGGGGYYAYRVYWNNDAAASAARNGNRAVRAQPVVVTRVARQPMPVEIVAIGTVQAISAVAVRTRIDSQIMQVHVADGQRVKAGAPMFTLDARQATAQLEQAKAALVRDRLQLANARRILQRMNPQLDARDTMDQARSQMDVAAASVLADEANVHFYSTQVSYTTIKAPISGRVGTIAYKQGNIVRANDPTPLATINQISPIYVAFSVPQKELPAFQDAIAKGAITVRASQPGIATAPQQGRVEYVENAIDTASGTFSVKARFANGDERLWPGAFVNVVANLRTEAGALVVSAHAVQASQEGAIVFVVRPDLTAEVRRVKINRTVGDQAVIEEGLADDEQVVIDGQLRLIEGSRVSIVKPRSLSAEDGRGPTPADGAPKAARKGKKGRAAAGAETSP